MEHFVMYLIRLLKLHLWGKNCLKEKHQCEWNGDGLCWIQDTGGNVLPLPSGAFPRIVNQEPPPVAPDLFTFPWVISVIFYDTSPTDSLETRSSPGAHESSCSDWYREHTGSLFQWDPWSESLPVPNGGSFLVLWPIRKRCPQMSRQALAT